MKAATTLRNARPYYTAALVALAAIHEAHGAFLGSNFVDCSACRFHAHNGADQTAVEHDGDYTFTRTYAVRDGELKVIERTHRAAGAVLPGYVDLHDALTAIARGGPFDGELAHLPQAQRYIEIARRALKGGVA